MIDKKRGKNGGYPVRVYNPAIGEKEWIGTFPDRQSAKEAHRKAEERFASRRKRAHCTVRAWSERWLDTYHGPGTARPEDTTRAHNADAIKAFVEQHALENLSRITEETAKDFAGEFGWRTKAVAAMFADAVRDGKLYESPFKGLSPKDGPGREDIDPLTTAEINRLAEIALARHDVYGPHFAAVILTAAWTGVRPAELGGWEWDDFNFETGEAKVRRQARKDRVVPYTKTKRNRTIVLADPVLDVLQRLARMHEYVFETRQGHRLRPGSVGYYWRPVRDAFADELPPSHWLPRRLQEDPGDRLDFYELRHMCGSIMAHNGANEFEIAEHLGNSPEVCRRVYIHPFRDQVRDRNRDVFRRAAQAAEDSLGTQIGSMDA